MARGNPTAQRITLAGLNPNLTAAPADGDILPAGQVALQIANGGGSPITVTVQTPGTVVGLAVADATVSVPAAATRLIGPFPSSVFAQPADASVGALGVLVDYSAVTSVTRAVISF